MTHFGPSATITSTTPEEWLGVGAKIGKLVNKWAGRYDLVAYIGDEASIESGSPARFIPATGEVEINTRISFPGATPEQVGDLTERSQQFEFPKGTGAILHEAMHARFSTFDIGQAQRELGARAWEGMYLLEEGRIEAFGVRTLPENKAFLRACAMDIVLGDVADWEAEALGSVRGVAKMIALTSARVTAGVLSADDIAPFTAIIPVVAPEGLIDALRPIWTEYQMLVPELHLERMYNLARKWAEVVASATEEAGESEDSEGEGESSPGSESRAEQIREAIQEILDNVEFGAIAEALDQQAKEDREGAIEQANRNSQEVRSARETASEVFSHGSGSADVRGTSSRLMETRPPSSSERASAVRIAQALERAKYRDRVRTETASATPPGRLRTRAIVQGRAMRKRGMMDTTTPWNRIQRRHVDDPDLTIGVMVDISGSMSSAMEPMASAAWVLSEATRRVQGRTAMVYYGSDVFHTLKPGQHLDKVTVYSASDSTEEFGKAFQALDGQLELLNGTGARLLVIVSDGQYRRDQVDEVRRVMKRCDQAGVAVLWIGAGSYGADAEKFCSSASSSFTRMAGAVTEVADRIGKLAEQALTNAGSRG